MANAEDALFAPERLNLKSLRQRAETLRSSIDEMCLALQQGNVIMYDNVINRFAVLNTLFSQLSDDLRALMKLYVVHPLAVEGPELGRVLGVMLSSKLTPEVELQMAIARAPLEQALAGLDAHSRYSHVNDAKDALADSVRMLLEPLPAGAGYLHDKGRAMSALRQVSKLVEAEIARLAALRQQVEAGGPQRQQGARGQQAAQDPRQAQLAAVVSGQLFKKAR